MLYTKPTNFCYLCGKLVSDEAVRRDEHGFVLHARCYDLKKTMLASAIQPVARKPQRSTGRADEPLVDRGQSAKAG